MNVVRGLLVALVLGWAFAVAAEVPVPPLTGRVVDRTGTLTSSDIESLTHKLREFEDRKGSQIAVLMVRTTEPETIEEFSIRVAEDWKIGRKKIDDGAILIIAKDDRRVRIEVGYGLEGSLTDATTKRIIEEDITPKFKNGDYAGGISAAVDRMIQVINGEALPPPEPPHGRSRDSPDAVDLFNPALIVVVLVVSGILRAVLGRLGGSTATGIIVGLLAWIATGSISASVILGAIAFGVALMAGAFPILGGGGYGHGGGWPGGGGRRDGGSGGDGGFSGGGGGFGGGGASGRW
jgi:uncharacterized protein